MSAINPLPSTSLYRLHTSTVYPPLRASHLAGRQVLGAVGRSDVHHQPFTVDKPLPSTPLYRLPSS
eukprot:5217250-Pyramimonas_sp.AAC.1